MFLPEEEIIKLDIEILQLTNEIQAFIFQTWDDPKSPKDGEALEITKAFAKELKELINKYSFTPY